MSGRATMTLKKYGLVIYTNWFVKMGGLTIGPLVFIKPKYKNDLGLLKHELLHTRQFWRSPILMGFRYLLSKKWRLRYEVECYREQLKWYPMDSEAKHAARAWAFAGFIANKYKLDITQAEAYRLLLNP